MHALFTALWQPAHFFVGNGLRCAWQFEAEQTLPWELFRGRLLDPRQTRETKTFLAWNLLPVENGAIAGAPLVSLLLDEPASEIHITRSILCRIWTPIDSTAGIDSEQRPTWVREFIGTISLASQGQHPGCSEQPGCSNPPPLESLAAEIQTLITHAILGTSRLPLTSTEAPLPQFTFGQLAYVPLRDLTTLDPRIPRRTWREILAASAEDFDEAQRAKVLEIVLRAAPSDQIPEVAAAFAGWLGEFPPPSPLWGEGPGVRGCPSPESISPSDHSGNKTPVVGPPLTPNPSLRRGEGSKTATELFLRMFNDISLSPYTDFVDKALAALASWPHRVPASEIDILARLTRQLVRHLTAYDLTLFHYRGANYPDALFLDALIRRLIVLATTHTELFATDSTPGRLRRRALRAGCLVRRHYEGHAVPDQPTSPGENIRILPAGHKPVPEDQIHEPHRRTRRLYEEEPLANLLTPEVRALLAHSFRDFTDPAELREGGMALFIDRPLGFFKAPAELDQTPLLSYEAFSRRLATRRLLDSRTFAANLTLDVSESIWSEGQKCLAEMSVTGLSLDRVPDSPRPAVSLADARKVADDFVVVRTTPRSLREFCSAIGAPSGSWSIVARIENESGQSVLTAFDEMGKKCAEFDGDWSQGSIVQRGIETPLAGIIWRDLD